MKRAVCFIIAIVMIVVSLTGCIGISGINQASNNNPCKENTVWTSEDGQIFFMVLKDDAGTGTIKTGDETFYFYIRFGQDDTTIELFPLENVDAANDIIKKGKASEIWSGDYSSNDRFNAIVKETTYFHVGDEITFIRIDDWPDYADTKNGS